MNRLRYGVVHNYIISNYIIPIFSIDTIIMNDYTSNMEKVASKIARAGVTGEKGPGSILGIKTLHIKECAEVLPGFSAKGAIFDEPGGTLQVITAQHLTKGEPYRYREEHRTRILPPRSLEKYLLEPGDILFMSRGANNYAVLLEEFPWPAIAPLTFFIIKPNRNLIVPAYLAWCLNQDMLRFKLNEIRTGAGTPMIPRQEFAEIEIPLPAMAVQGQIANFASFQTQEKALLQQLSEETERLQRLRGQQLLAHLTKEKKE
jgi:hypothetical protein